MNHNNLKERVMKKTHRTRNLVLVAAAALALLGVGGFAISKSIGNKVIAAMAASPSTATVPGMNLVATVNGEPIFESELAPLLQNMPHAVAVDSYINKVLTAQEAKAESSDTAVAVRKQMAEREVLSALYFSLVGEKESKGVSDADISQFYERNLSDKMFAKAEASYFLSASEEESTQFAVKLRDGDKEASAKLKPFQNAAGKPASFAPGEFPYDMGKIIQNMKAGEVSGALATRNGFFVVRVDGVIAGKRPALKDVKEQLRSAMVNQRVGERLQKLRKNAKIELKS